jgi:hypothetical protein
MMLHRGKVASRLVASAFTDRAVRIDPRSDGWSNPP